MKKNWKILSLVSIILFFLLFYLLYIKNIPIRYDDEAHWIGRSYFFELFLKRDFNNKLWQSEFAYDQMMLQSYIYGILLYPKYLILKTKNKSIDLGKFLIEHNFYFISGKSYINYKDKLINFINWGPQDYNVSPQNLLSKYGKNFEKTIEIIFIARKFNALLLSINLLIIYILTSLISNNLIAIITVIFYGFNKLIILTSLIAHAEALFLLIFNLGLLILLYIFNSKKELFTHLFFGIISALCAQTKLNGFLLIIFYDILIIFQSIYYFLNNQIDNFKKNILYFLITNFSCFFIFFFLNPFFYSNPFNNLIFAINYRKKTASQQAQYLGPALTSFSDRIKTLYFNFFDKSKNNYNYSYPLFLKENKIFNLLLIIGFFFGVYNFLLDFFKKKLPLKKSIFLFIFILLNIALGIYLYLDWDRYFDIIVIFFIFFQIHGIFSLVNNFLSLIISQK